MNRNILLIGIKEKNADKLYYKLNQTHKNYEFMRGYLLQKDITYVQLLGITLQFYDTIMKEARRENKSLVMDMQGLRLQEALKCFGKECDIYCFGLTREKASHIQEEIIKQKEKYKNCNVSFVYEKGESEQEIKEIVRVMEKITINDNRRA